MTFSNVRALYAAGFIEQLKHTKGKWAGKPFELLPWQHDVISQVYGTLDDTGRRQYQYCYLEIPKKNGKSELGAGIALYHTFADGEAKGEIYGCAADKAQASLVFDVAVDMIDQSPALKKRSRLKLSWKEIHDTLTGSIYKVVSAEAFTKHGLNASCVIFDELHAQPNRDLWDVMTFGAGDARDEPMWYVITTAGDDPDRNSIGWEIHDKARRIVDGEIIDPRWFCRIWGLEPGYEGDIWDEALWYRVNPSLGQTIDIDKVRRAALSAKSSEAEERNFRWLRLNQWIENKTTSWLPLTLWDENCASLPPDELLGKRCYVGIDLSSVGDLTGIATLFPPQDGLEHYYCVFDAFIPAENMKEKEACDHVSYSKWQKHGCVTATQGDVIDYEYIKARLWQLDRLYDVVCYGNDPWGAEKLRQDLYRGDDEHSPIELTEVRQGGITMSPTMKEIERLLRLGELKHEENPLARWCFGNVRLELDKNENYRAVKGRRFERIDPIVALINAMYVCMKNEGGSVYDGRGVVFA